MPAGRQIPTNRLKHWGELRDALSLQVPINKIECYDISNIQGTASVGSMVIFEQGVPNKKNYRQFNIKSVDGPDDFASMEEVLTRRFGRWKAAEEENIPGKKPDPAFSILPDLLIVDGGKGQLGRAVKVLETYGLQERVPVVGLAKQQEELFRPGIAESVLLPRHSQALYLILTHPRRSAPLCHHCPPQETHKDRSGFPSGFHPGSRPQPA